MAKPRTLQRDVREVVRGLVVRLPSGQDEVVRSVSVVLHMANGQDVVLDAGAKIPVLVDEPVREV